MCLHASPAPRGGFRERKQGEGGEGGKGRKGGEREEDRVINLHKLSLQKERSVFEIAIEL